MLKPGKMKEIAEQIQNTSATNSSTSRNQMERVWRHQEKRLFTPP
jgi:hypothetical protein